MRKLFVAGLFVAGLMMIATQPSQAMSLSGPGMAATAKFASEGMITEVRGGHGGRGGHGFHGGGRHFGGRRFGGRRFGGFRGYHRRHFAIYRGWGRPYRARFYAFAPRRRCYIVMTYYGPERVCRLPRRWY